MSELAQAGDFDMVSRGGRLIVFSFQFWLLKGVLAVRISRQVIITKVERAGQR